MNRDSYISARCPVCHQDIPFDPGQKVCFCLYCGRPVTAEHIIQHKDSSHENVIGEIFDEYAVPPRGIVVTTCVKNRISTGTRVAFLGDNDTIISRGTITGIECEGNIIDFAEEGMSVGILVSPAGRNKLTGSTMIFDNLK